MRIYLTKHAVIDPTELTAEDAAFLTALGGVDVLERLASGRRGALSSLDYFYPAVKVAVRGER